MTQMANPSVEQRLAMIEQSINAGASLQAACALAVASPEAIASYLSGSLEGRVLALLLRYAARPAETPGAVRPDDRSAEIAALEDRIGALEGRTRRSDRRSS
jgi:hypothetical protein